MAIGNERREKHNFKHKNLKVIDWLPHEKILNYYKKSSISVVCSRWQEPFGRTAMESAANISKLTGVNMAAIANQGDVMAQNPTKQKIAGRYFRL